MIVVLHSHTKRRRERGQQQLSTQQFAREKGVCVCVYWESVFGVTSGVDSIIDVKGGHTPIGPVTSLTLRSGPGDLRKALQM